MATTDSNGDEDTDTFQHNDAGGLTQHDDEKGSREYIVDADGNRLDSIGLVDPYNRVIRTATGEFKFDNEGNVIERKTAKNVGVISFDVRTSGISAAHEVDDSATYSVSKGPYRVRVPSFVIGNFANNSNFENLQLEIRAGDKTIYTKTLAPPQPVGNGNNTYDYHFSPIFAEFTVDTFNEAFKIEVKFVVNLEYSETSIDVKADFYVDHWIHQQSLDWDYQNRLDHVTQHSLVGGDTVHEYSYVYDALGNRVARLVDSSTTAEVVYVREGGNVLLEYGEDQQLDRHYMYAADGSLLALENLTVEAFGGETIWAFADYQNTVTQLYTPGKEVKELQYDAFGVPADFGDDNSDTLTSAAGLIPGKFGVEMDHEVDLSFVGSRVYDPYAGRFITENPAGVLSGETNLYAMPGRTSAANLFAGGRSDGIDHSAGGSETFAGQFFSRERLTGLLQAVGGVGEAFVGIAGAIETGGVSLLAAAKGIDDAIAGYRQFVTGEYQPTFTHQAAHTITGNETFATSFDFATSISLSAGSAAAKAASKATAVTRSLRNAAFGKLGRVTGHGDDFFRTHRLPVLDNLGCFVAGTAFIFDSALTGDAQYAMTFVASSLPNGQDTGTATFGVWDGELFAWAGGVLAASAIGAVANRRAKERRRNRQMDCGEKGWFDLFYPELREAIGLLTAERSREIQHFKIH